MVGCGHDQREREGDTSHNRRSGTGGAKSLPSEDGEGGHPGGGEAQEGNSEHFPTFGPLKDANELGIRLPEGYSVKLIATSGERPLEKLDYVWPAYPDGGACFSDSEGGWVYVVNSEVSDGGGGVSSLKFSADGALTSTYAIATGTSRNCQGGTTPGGSWLTCEEVIDGRVIECDPLGNKPAEQRLALGRFFREGLAYDEQRHHLYMTEDLVDGAFYRFIPSRVKGGAADLTEGVLEVARFVGNDEIEWVKVPDPEALAGVATRYQVPDCAKFNGGEGVWWQDGIVYFTTKGDDRVWRLDTETWRISVLYDRASAMNPVLSGVDDIIGTASGELLVAEDAGDMQIIVITADGNLKPLVQVVGQDASEITGLAFSPDGSRLYFSSQRGGPTGQGLTYEVTGPFV